MVTLCFFCAPSVAMVLQVLSCRNTAGFLASSVRLCFVGVAEMAREGREQALGLLERRYDARMHLERATLSIWRT
jgi:hypothetical protein